MTKKHLFFVIATLAITIICIVALSFAWFMSNGTQKVGTDGLRISAYDPSVLTIGAKILQRTGQYRGETGLVYYKYVDTSNGDYKYVYDDDGNIVTKTFPYFTYTASRWEYFTYTWNGESSRTYKCTGTVTMSSFDEFSLNSTAHVQIVEQRGTYFYVFCNDKNEEKYTSQDGVISFIGSTPFSASLITFKQGSKTLSISFLNKVEEIDYTDYYNDGGTYTRIDRKNNKTAVRNNNKDLHVHSGDNYSVVFSESERTTEVSRRLKHKSDTCFTVVENSATRTTISNQTTQIIRTKNGSTYSYEIYINGAHEYSSSNTSNPKDIIDVAEYQQVAYAVIDTATEEDKAYSIAKQFDLIVDGQDGTNYNLEFGTDIMGIIPETQAAAEYLSQIPGVEVSNAYYTFIGTEEGSSVLFGVDADITGANTENEVIKSYSYDDEYYTVTSISYGEYVDSADRYFVTTKGLPLYVYDAQADDYLMLTTAYGANVAEIEQKVDNGTLQLFILRASLYTAYSHDESCIESYGDVVMSTITTQGLNLYHKLSVPAYRAATASETLMGEGLYYLDENDSYVAATEEIVAACQPLYVLQDGVRIAATEAQIAAGEGLYYLRNGADELATAEELALRKPLCVRVNVFSVATAEEMDAGADLYSRSLTSVVYDAHNDSVVYNADNATIVVERRIMYALPNELLYQYFTVEIDVCDRTSISESVWESMSEEDKISATTRYYVDDQGRLRDAPENGNAFVPAAGDRILYCRMTLYFLDKWTLNHLFSDDNGVEYIYQYKGASSGYYSNGKGNLHEFEFSDSMFMGSHFVLRMYVGSTQTN